MGVPFARGCLKLTLRELKLVETEVIAGAFGTFIIYLTLLLGNDASESPYKLLAIIFIVKNVLIGRFGIISGVVVPSISIKEVLFPIAYKYCVIGEPLLTIFPRLTTA